MKFSPGFRGLLLAALAAGLRAEEKPADQPAKTGNWLVDAMAEKTGDARDDAKPGASPADRGSQTRGSSAYAKPEDPNANPLSSYLTTWMTPRDLEILKIKGTDGSTPGITSGVEPGHPGTRGQTPGLRINPYLAEPAPAPAVNAKQPPNLPAAPPPSLAPPAPKNDAAPAKTPGPPPDVRKSQDDSKYFPQLKHF